MIGGCCVDTLAYGGYSNDYPLVLTGTRCVYFLPNMARSHRTATITLTQEQFDNLLASREPQAPRTPRPTIGLDASEEDWRLFTFQWRRYKTSTRFTPTAAVDQLLSACSPELERRLFNLRGTSLSTITEDNLLQENKSVAMRGLHTAVHRREFHSMRQGEGEDLAQFVARLRAKGPLRLQWHGSSPPGRQQRTRSTEL